MAVHQAQLHPLVAELDKDIRIAILVADFNPEITHALLDKNSTFLHQNDFTNIDTFHVPGACELPASATRIAESGIYHLIITIGCLIRGETPHFDVIAEAATQGLTQVSMTYDTPLIFGLLTCDTKEQAQARVDHNYAIYGLNYVAQHLLNTNILEAHTENFQQQATAFFQELS